MFNIDKGHCVSIEQRLLYNIQELEQKILEMLKVRDNEQKTIVIDTPKIEKGGDLKHGKNSRNIQKSKL